MSPAKISQPDPTSEIADTTTMASPRKSKIPSRLTGPGNYVNGPTYAPSPGAKKLGLPQPLVPEQRTLKQTQTRPPSMDDMAIRPVSDAPIVQGPTGKANPSLCLEATGTGRPPSRRHAHRLAVVVPDGELVQPGTSRQVINKRPLMTPSSRPRSFSDRVKDLFRGKQKRSTPPSPESVSTQEVVVDCASPLQKRPACPIVCSSLDIMCGSMSRSPEDHATKLTQALERPSKNHLPNEDAAKLTQALEDCIENCKQAKAAAALAEEQARIAGAHAENAQRTLKEVLSKVERGVGNSMDLEGMKEKMGKEGLL